MSCPHYLCSRWGSIGLTLLRVTAVSAIPVGAVLLLHFGKGIPVGDLTRDPIATLGAPVYIGLLSQAGIFVWAGAAGACLATARVLRILPDRMWMRNFFYASALLSLFLGIDDAFLLHERVLPAIGVPEIVVYAVYVAITLSWLATYRCAILNTEYFLLMIALFLLGVSLVIDMIDPALTGRVLLEDSLKLVGMVTWLAYFLHAGSNAARRSTEAAG